jgi:hypothetical protein
MIKVIHKKSPCPATKTIPTVAGREISRESIWCPSRNGRFWFPARPE